MNIALINQATSDLAEAIQRELLETQQTRDNLLIAVDVTEKNVLAELQLLRDYIKAHHTAQANFLNNFLSVPS